jgi:hypothetical protein
MKTKIIEEKAKIKAMAFRITTDNRAGACWEEAPAGTPPFTFAFSSIIFVFIFFWGVVDWIWAGGDKEGIAKARQKITQSIIGLVLLSLSFAIMAIISQITSINLIGDIVLPSFMNP